MDSATKSKDEEMVEEKDKMVKKEEEEIIRRQKHVEEAKVKLRIANELYIRKYKVSSVYRNLN